MTEKELNATVYISLEYSYIYFSSPKCACSTVKNTIQRKEAELMNIVLPKGYNVHKSHFPLLAIKDIGIEKFFDLLKSENIVKFSIVRNPFTRLLSAYLEKIVFPDIPFWEGRIELYRRAGKDPNKTMTFEEFLQTISQLSFYEMDQHWRPLTYKLFWDSVDYSYIGYFENLDHDLKNILNIIYSSEVDIKKRANVPTDANKKLHDYYDESTQALVLDIYREDFLNFNYPQTL